MVKAVNKRDEQVRGNLTKFIRRDLYRSQNRLQKSSKKRLGLLFEVPIFIENPRAVDFDPQMSIQEIEVSWEPGLADGPTSSRFKVLDFNPDSGVLVPPARWNQNLWRFEDENGLPLAAVDQHSFQYHQLNVWTTAQRVLEYFESPWALGRPIPWGFEGNRLIMMPHAGTGKKAIYDRKSKSLRFMSFGTEMERFHTSLSLDIIAHTVGHAMLDGIRPYYLELSSLETAAFHEFVADLTAILMALDNIDVRHSMAEANWADLNRHEAVSSLAETFGGHVQDRPYLRSAMARMTMADIEGISDVRHISQVLTSAMFQILMRIASRYMDGNERRRNEGKKRMTTPQQEFYFSYWRTVRRITLQPLDYCPPADIRFIDYARAVIHNLWKTNPEDEYELQFIIADVFHEWGFCQRTEQEHEAGICDLNNPNKLLGRNMISLDIDNISRSRTSAYRFLNDNREVFRIPRNEDFFVVDLYDTNKLGVEANRLPRETVVQYLWREAIDLAGPEFGELDGTSVPLLCGGTIVFDREANIVSWSYKPGTQLAIDQEAGERRAEHLLETIKALAKTGKLSTGEGVGGLPCIGFFRASH